MRSRDERHPLLLAAFLVLCAAGIAGAQVRVTPASTSPSSLGTAAAKNTGTTAGTIPLLDSGGLPAVSGAALTNVAAATLGGATFAAPGPIGSGTPGTGAHTTLTASTSLAVGGASPTTITNIRIYTPSLTPAQLAAAIGVTEQTFTVTGLTTADKVFVNGPAPTPLCPPVTYRVSATDTLAISFVDLTVALCTPPAGTYVVLAVRS